VLPAVSEEILSRLVGVGLLLALTRRRWLAVVVPGLLWAFAHLSYVRDPIYLRGLELALEAVLYGIIFLRYGLATTIVAHLAWNSFGTALPMLRSGQPYLVANGALVVIGLLALLVPGALHWLRRRREGAAQTPPPEIHPATRDDLPGLAELDGAANWSAWLDSPVVQVLSLHAGARIVGAAAGRLDEGQVGHVLTLCVAPDYRRRYWGSRLAGALSEALREKGATPLKVTVPAQDADLARFWDAQGWRPGEVVYVTPPGAAGDNELAAALRRVIQRLRRAWRRLHRTP
jgi:ribosomal protein S18 acetylase RimI-like enzyme